MKNILGIILLTTAMTIVIDFIVALSPIMTVFLVTVVFIIGSVNAYKGKKAYSVRRMFQQKQPPMMVIVAFLLAVSMKGDVVLELLKITTIFSIGTGLVYSAVYELVRLKFNQLVPASKIWASAIKL